MFKSGKKTKVAEIKKFLAPFKLSKPTNGYGEKRKPLKRGGVYGDHGIAINDLLLKMI